MNKQTEAMKLALEALAERFSEGWHEGIKIDALDIELLADAAQALAEQPAQQALDKMAENARELGLDYEPAQQEPVVAIRALTDQCFALIQERDELQKQVWRYEKNGVTCQTYRHKVDASCAECNVHEVYTSPPAQQALDKKAENARELGLDYEPVQQEPVARQYQSRDGVWKDFISEKHYKDTLEDGSWPIRNLYTSPKPPQRKEDK